jgi:hypothetical protein
MFAIDYFVPEYFSTDFWSFGIDTVLPVSTLVSAPSVTVAGATSYNIQIRYTDNISIDISTIGTGGIRVTGPKSFVSNPSFVSIDINTNGSPRVATYRLTPPGGSFNNADNGTYTISQIAGSVRDVSGNLIGASVLGSFVVNIPRK